MSATHLTPQPVTLPTVRQLITELAATEDDLRAMRVAGSTDRRLAVARRQARILRELRRRHGTVH